VTTAARAVPFYCPYCGEEDLRPYADTHGTWWCAACRRAWTLRFLGTGTPGETPDGPDGPDGPDAPGGPDRPSGPDPEAGAIPPA
jgi:hypothetical protein